MSSGESRKAQAGRRKQIQESSWQSFESLVKLKSCPVESDRGSTLKTEQSFAKSVRV